MGKLTDGKSGTIAKAEPPEKGARFIFDDHRSAPSGFALRITQAGGKAFVLRYTVDGRTRLKTIGDWPVWSLEAARDEAQNLSREIRRGHDPLEAARRRKEAPTVATLAKEWLDRHASGLKSEGAIRGYINNDLVPALGHMKVADVKRRDVIEVIEAKAEKTPRAAAQLLLYARRLMDYATDRDFIPANPLAGLKPGAIAVKGRRDALSPKVRMRVLDRDEIAGLWNRAESCGMHRLTALALKMILVTGQRPGEVAGMHKDEIDGRIWTIPASRRGKTETEHRVYLTDTALDLIDTAKAEIMRLQKRREQPWSGFIFETAPGAPVTVSAIWRAVHRRAVALDAQDLSPKGMWRPHDLRRSMRTGLSACGVRPDIAELTIGHTKRGITAVYDQHGYDAERRAALEAWEARLLRIAAGEDPDGAQGDNVVSLAGAR